jgi:hypothetical protein
MIKAKRIPKSLQPILCSYNLKELNLKEDNETIITQVLNYGSWEDVKWLYSVYPEKEIKKVVSRPKRGLWFERILNLWEKMFDIHIPAKTRRKSIFNIKPNFK